MTSSSLALQQAIYTTLTTNTSLATQLGGPRIYDEAPQPVVFPYISFGPSTVRDADTATDHSDEHLLTLYLWSRAHGRKETHALVDLLRAALHDQPLTLVAHRLINLRHDSTDTRRLPDGQTTQATVRFRAVTEPL